MKSLTLNLAAFIVVLVEAVMSHSSGSAHAPALSLSCGCSQPMNSNVPCLVSAAEDTFRQKMLDKPEPAYPATAKTARVSGDVSVGVIVDPTGKVMFAWVEKSDDAALSSAALDAAYRLRVQPTVLSGQPVTVKSVVTYNFRLA